MSICLEVKNLSKKYGSTIAVKDISFTVNTGEIFSIIGPNGAGKTSTIRMISTIITPSSGDCFIDGHSLVKSPNKVRENITYLPDEAGAYKNMTGNYYLKFMASMVSSEKLKQKEYFENAIKICKLGDRLKDKISSYSRGMIRKLLISRAVMNKPKLAILDEATSGLDIINALEIRRMIKELAKKGTSFLLSSHNMLEIEYLSDRIAIINKGVIYEIGEPVAIKQKYNAQNLEEVFEKVAKNI